mmetsp:Transcript_3719/g.14131  ORF Transcript_3719/g.14131 Transcript_3719/m.14131 type:complete len:112 (-) Transcript_3719:6439-6774(-)
MGKMICSSAQSTLASTSGGTNRKWTIERNCLVDPSAVIVLRIFVMDIVPPYAAKPFCCSHLGAAALQSIENFLWISILIENLVDSRKQGKVLLTVSAIQHSHDLLNCDGSL